MALFKKKKLTEEERASKKTAFERRIGQKPIWTGRDECLYAIPGRNLIIGVKVDFHKTIPEVMEPLFP